MPEIQEYRFGHIVIDGREHTRDVIILPGRVVGNWWRKEGHGLAIEDLREVLDEIPGHLILGTGAQAQMKPDPQTLETLKSRGVEVEILPTDEAVRRYRQLQPAQVAAALHLTC